MKITGDAILEELRRQKSELSRTYHIRSIGIFGSFARGEERDDSDIDILVSFDRPVGWAVFSLERELEGSFGRRVDLVTQDALKPELRSSILSELRTA